MSETLHADLQTGLGDEFWTEEHTAKVLGKTPRTLRKWRERRCGPPYIKIGRDIMYRRASMFAWLVANETKPVRSSRQGG